MSKDKPSSDEEAARGLLGGYSRAKFTRPRLLEWRLLPRILAASLALFLLLQGYLFLTHQRQQEPLVPSNKGDLASHDLINTSPPKDDSFQSLRPPPIDSKPPKPSTSWLSSWLPAHETKLTKTIIVASTSKENTTWVKEHFAKEWQLAIYVVDDPNATYTVAYQGGNEAGVFLSYVIDNYDTLPDIMLFHHADRYQWHNEDPMFDGVNVINNLKLDHVRDQGFTTLRCSWFPGCPINVEIEAGHTDAWDEQMGQTAERYLDWFPQRPLPDHLGAPCCAQFALTRAQVQLRAKAEYEHMREWIWDDRLMAHNSGRVMEYLWHVVFSKPDVDCPNAEVCFCKKFGLCNLKCPEESFCEGRWYMPPFWTKIPTTWPTINHDVTGMKQYGWWHEFYPNETFGLAWTNVPLHKQQAEKAELAQAQANEEAKEKATEAQGLKSAGAHFDTMNNATNVIVGASSVKAGSVKASSAKATVAVTKLAMAKETSITTSEAAAAKAKAGGKAMANDLETASKYKLAPP